MTSTRSTHTLRLVGLVAASGLILTGLVAPAFAATKYPPKPTGLRASASSSAIYLNWTSGKGSTKGFNVYRSTSSTVRLKYPLNGKKLLTRTSFSNLRLSSNKSYWFVVQSVNAKGLKSASGKLKVTTLAKAPSVPVLSAVAGDHKVSLTWKAGATGGTVTSWNVYRSTTATTASGIATAANLLTKTKLAASTRAYSDPTTANGTTYRYVVVGANSGGKATSNVASATPLVPAPGVPSAPTLNATAGDGTVGLSWSAGAGGGAVAGWSIYRSETNPVSTAGSPLTTIAVGTTVYADNSAVNGTQYFYKVTANNVTGSTASNQVSATPSAPVVAAPSAPVLNATAGDGTVGLSWTPGVGGGAVAGWSIYRSETNPVSTAGSALATTGVGTTTYADDTAVNGTTYYYKVTANNATASTASNQVSASPSAGSNAVLAVTNPEAITGTNRFVMSRMSYAATPDSIVRLGNPDNPIDDTDPIDPGKPTWYRVHDLVQVHLENTGTTTAHITGLASSDALTFSTTTSAPFDLAAGASIDIPVRFVYLGGPNHCAGADTSFYGARVCSGTLTVSATGVSDKVVPLAGVWQPGPNRSTDASQTNFEPRMSKLMNDLFGFQTDYGVGPNDPLDSGNASYLFSADEVSSRFWQAADSAQPVTVRRLAAYTARLAAIRYYPSSSVTGCSTAAEASCQEIAPVYTGSGTSELYDETKAHLAQSILPVPTGAPASYSFSPGAAAFGLQFDIGFSREFSDHTRNSTTNDTTLHGCTPVADCGQHVRFFKLRDTSGAVVPNTYLVSFDALGLNNDFNDNVVLISNITTD